DDKFITTDYLQQCPVENCKYDKEDLGFRHAEGTDMMIGFRVSDGKILKSPTYSDVDLTCFVEKAKSSSLYEMVKNNCK
ncbi:hypothetical protein ACMS8J_004663, partial [Escherichia coli O140:H48]